MAREPETIASEIDKLEQIIKRCKGKPGFAARVAEAEGRLGECKAELAALND
jgi:hypothetical protein